MMEATLREIGNTLLDLSLSDIQIFLLGDFLHVLMGAAGFILFCVLITVYAIWAVPEVRG